jgi:hypothetical protein
MTSEAAILKGKGIVSNPEFILTFFLAASMGIAAMGTIGISGMWGWILVGITALLAAISVFTGMGQKFFVILLALTSFLVGLGVIAILSYLWAIPAGDGGHGQPLWAGLLALLMIALPVATIYGERILPLFVGFIAGVWGILSVIIFVMVVFIGVD